VVKWSASIVAQFLDSIPIHVLLQESTVPTGRTYCPIANPHSIILHNTLIFINLAVKASHLAITSPKVLATAYCDIDMEGTNMYPGHTTDDTQRPPHATAACIITTITDYHNSWCHKVSSWFVCLSILGFKTMIFQSRPGTMQFIWSTHVSAHIPDQVAAQT
jgi:hypothetical protein